MKAKHQYLFSIACILFAIGITTAYWASDFWNIDNTVSGRSGMQPLPVYTELSPMEIRLIDQLSPKLAILPNPPVREKTFSDLRLLGFVSQSTGSPGFFRTKQADRKNLVDFLLSFTFSSGKKRFCIIDGVFYQEGDHLPDETRILRVANRKVLLEKNGIQNWVHIADRSADQPQTPTSGLKPKKPSAKEKI